MNSITYSYHNHYGEKIIIKTYQGDIYFEDITDSWEKAIQEGVVKPYCKGVINDYRNADIKMSIDNIEKLMEFFTETGKFKKFRFALVVEKPDQVVYPTLAGMIETEFLTSPFITENAAIHWILDGER